MYLYFSKRTDERSNSFLRTFRISFREFMEATSARLNLLLLAHLLEDVQEIHELHLQGLLQPWLEEALEQSTSFDSDFCWVDFQSLDDLLKIDRDELAELCYLRIQSTPFEKPYFPSLNNRFLYQGHDDGWMTSIYFTHEEDEHQFCSGALTTKCKNAYGVEIDQLVTTELLRRWAETKEGLLIEFEEKEDGSLSWILAREVGLYETADCLERDRNWDEGEPYVLMAPQA